jgi:hypothetical protein
LVVKLLDGRRSETRSSLTLRKPIAAAEFPPSLPALRKPDAGRGASIFKMMDVSRHKSMGTLRGYVRDAELFRDHAGAGLL